jgi:hypothetical protein
VANDEDADRAHEECYGGQSEDIVCDIPRGETLVGVTDYCLDLTGLHVPEMPMVLVPVAFFGGERVTFEHAH